MKGEKWKMKILLKVIQDDYRFDLSKNHNINLEYLIFFSGNISWIKNNWIFYKSEDLEFNI